MTVGGSANTFRVRSLRRDRAFLPGRRHATVPVFMSLSCWKTGMFDDLIYVWLTLVSENKYTRQNKRKKRNEKKRIRYGL